MARTVTTSPPTRQRRPGSAAVPPRICSPGGPRTRPTRMRWRSPATKAPSAGPPRGTVTRSRRRTPAAANESSARLSEAPLDTTSTAAPPPRCRSIPPSRGPVGGVSHKARPGHTNALHARAPPVLPSHRQTGSDDLEWPSARATTPSDSAAAPPAPSRPNGRPADTPRHAADPAEQPARGGDEQRGGAPAERRARQPCRQAPDGHPRGRGCRQDVGGDGGHGQASEGRDQQRCHADLGGEGDRRRTGQRAGPGERPGERARQGDDARRRPDRQREPDGVDEERVDQQQGGHGQRQAATRPGRSAERHAGGGDGRHDRCPQHRGLEARDEGEEQQQRQGDGEPRPQSAATQQGCHHGEQQRDVLAGDDEQVGEPRGPEVAGDLGRLPAGIAQHEAVEQRTLLVGQRRGRRLDQRTHPGGQSPGPGGSARPDAGCRPAAAPPRGASAGRPRRRGAATRPRRP